MAVADVSSGQPRCIPRRPPFNCFHYELRNDALSLHGRVQLIVPTSPNTTCTSVTQLRAREEQVHVPQEAICVSSGRVGAYTRIRWALVQLIHAGMYGTRDIERRGPVQEALRRIIHVREQRMRVEEGYRVYQ